MLMLADWLVGWLAGRQAAAVVAILWVSCIRMPFSASVDMLEYSKGGGGKNSVII